MEWPIVSHWAQDVRRKDRRSVRSAKVFVGANMYSVSIQSRFSSTFKCIQNAFKQKALGAARSLVCVFNAWLEVTRGDTKLDAAAH